MTTLQPQKPLSLKELYKRMGDSGTERYSGYFMEEPNAQWRDEARVDNVETMRRTDGTVKQILTALKAPLLSANWFTAIDSKDKTDLEIREWAEQNRLKMNRTWKSFLRESLTYLDFGYSVFEKIYKKGEDGKIWLMDLEPRIQRSIQSWQLIDGRRGVVQQITTNEAEELDVEIPLSKLFVLTNDMEGDDITGQSVLRPAYKHFYIKDKLYRISAISAERFGVGVLKVTLPEGFGTEEKSEAEELAKNFKANEESRIIVPSGWEIDIVTPQGNPEASSIESLISHHDRMIAVSIMAGFLNLGSSSTGSFALSKDQSSFFLKHIEDKAGYIAEEFTRQVLNPLIELNFGKRKIMPYLTFSKLGDIDFGEYADSITKLLNAGAVNMNAKVKQYLHKTFSLPEISNEEMEILEKLEKEILKNKKEGKEESSDIDLRNTRETPEKKEEPKEDEPTPPEKGEKKKEEKEKTFTEQVEELAQKKKGKYYRELTLQEERCDFKYLNEQFNELESGLADDLAVIIQEDVEKTAKRISEKLKLGDLAAIAAMLMLSKQQIKEIIKKYQTAAFESGKKTASDELEVDREKTTRKQQQLMNYEADQLASGFVQDIEAETKEVVRQGLAKDVAAIGIIAAVANRMRDRSSRLMTNIQGSLVGENVNKGRRFVFERNITQIKAFQRSEILDNRTCNMCLSLDGRVVTSDDPMSKLDLVHTNCRGIWIPIKQDEQIIGTVGLPKTITDGFDTIGGAPTNNSFKQLKNPINRSNEGVQEEILKRLKK